MAAVLHPTALGEKKPWQHYTAGVIPKLMSVVLSKSVYMAVCYGIESYQRLANGGSQCGFIQNKSQHLKNNHIIQQVWNEFEPGLRRVNDQKQM